MRGGRNVYEGYQRGWGLQFGDLKTRVTEDPLYGESTKLAQGRTVVSEPNRMNLYLMLRFFLSRIPFGHIVEYGSYKGGNAIFMANVVKKLYPGMKVFALDTFTGMVPTDRNVDLHREGDFADVDLAELKRYAQSLKLDNLEFVKGRFEETNAAVIEKAGSVSLAYIDCDVSSAVKFAYEGVKPRMVEGGYIVFDDATVSSCIGATEVVEEVLIRRDGLSSEQIWPHFVFRAM